MRNIRTLLFLVTTLFVLSGRSMADTCTSNSDCAKGYYCYKATGDCDGKGECTAKPQMCPEIWDPVCGCDGQTYGNACEAAAAGINVSYEGECAPGACTNNEDCPSSYFCYKNPGDCDGIGVCTAKPQACPDVWDPVCACDGNTYANECEAAAAGLNVAYPGECLPAGPTTVMMDPHVANDDVHSGPSGLDMLRILWSEPVIFDASDITIVNEHGLPVIFEVSGSNSAIMTISFKGALLFDRYTITVADSVVSAPTGYPIDGDDDGIASGAATIIIEHRIRSDFNNDNLVNFTDLASLADDWLSELD